VGVHYERRHGIFRSQRFWALEDISFSLYHGETLGIIGRNGAGKSTLLRLLAGIIGPDRGRVEQHGCRASLLSLQAGFLPRLSGRENAILSGILLGLSRKSVLRKLASIFEFAELQDAIDEPLHTYSAGMRARLGFAVAFQANPDILLVDEVLGVGDQQFREKSSLALRELICSDKTVVLVSHNLDTIRDLCDRLVWIKDRRTFREGATDDVLQEYQDTMNPKKRS
jgi:lipopolysaccharide transport system ATP-binding protein